MSDFPNVLRKTKRRLLQLHYDGHCGHLGGNFSCIDALMVLHHMVMTPNDRFILSKGHSAGALYATLWSLGKLTDADLTTFAQDDSLLPGHPSGNGIPGLLFSTGSLGHGPSLAAGLAIAARHSRSARRVFCMCSDGEWQEGSCWEALSFAVHQRLDQLHILIDQNRWQGFGRTADVISCEDLAPRVASFGACVRTVDGHDPQAIAAALMAVAPGQPTVVLLETVKGRGLHFENQLESHYLPLTETQLRQALSNLESGGMP